jgi:ankyrin repeat protein
MTGRLFVSTFCKFLLNTILAILGVALIGCAQNPHAAEISTNYVGNINTNYTGVIVSDNESVFNNTNNARIVTLLHWAVRENNVPLVQRLVAGGVNVNSFDWNHRTPLYWATDLNLPEMVSILFMHGADPMLQDNNGINPFQLALLNGFTALARQLSEGKLDLLATDVHGDSLLFWAVRHNVPYGVELLLKKGASIESLDTQGKSAFQVAVEIGAADVVKQFLSEGVPVNSADKQGRTPLHWAITNHDEKIAKLLLSNKADVNTRDSSGKAPVDLAWEENRADEIKWLLPYKPDVNHKRPDGFSPLFWALQRDRLDVAEALVACGADLDARDNKGDTLLLCAFHFNHPNGIDFLLAKGANPNIEGQMFTPFSWACSQNNTQMASRLLQYHADPNFRCKNSPTPLLWAYLKQNAMMIEFLQKNGARYDSGALRLAVSNGLRELAFTAISQGADVNEPGPDRQTALHTAACQADLEMVKTLLAHGANPNAADSNGWTPLHCVALSDSVEIAEILITHGANVNALYQSSITPLHQAVLKNRLKMVRLLIAKGADVNALMQSTHETPVGVAEHNGCKEILELLKQNGGHE